MKGKMLSFTGSLSLNSDAFAIFVTEKYVYKDKKGILAADTIKKINSFIGVLKVQKKEDINSFDISNRQKCFIIKVKHKYESFFPQESGGTFYTYLKRFKDIKKIDLYPDSLELDKDKLVRFFTEFIFGFNLKSYTFNKYKTLDKDKVD